MSKDKMTNFRWMICSLLFFATAVNYLDRQVLSLTWKDFIAPEFHWTDKDYGIITGYFSLIYAFCNLFAGKFIDWMGNKKGYLWAIFIWSFAACLHAVCGWGTVHLVDGVGSVSALKTLQAGSAVALSVASVSVWLFLGCRCFLALGEAGNFPAAIKITAEYFPKKDRAFSTSIFNSGSSIGALAAPALIPVIARHWGWESAFVIIGALGFIWMGFWQFLYKKPGENPRVNAEELAYINSDSDDEAANRAVEQSSNEPKISYLQAFKLRHTWSLIFGRFLTDGVWWFFLFWTPGYLSDQFGYTSDSRMGMALIITLYTIATFGSIALCKLPTFFMVRRGLNSYDGRMKAMFIFACFPLLALGAQPLGATSAWFPAILIGFACAGHQAWSANVYSVVGDMFPKSTIGTLTGIAQCAAGIGSFLVNITAGKLFSYAAGTTIVNGKEVEMTKELLAGGAKFARPAMEFLGYTGKPAGYLIVFGYCAVAYILGWIFMKAFVPRYKKVEL